MYYIELGNQAGSPNYGELTNRGPFNDLKEALYWSGTVNQKDEVWLFSFFSGVQEIKAKDTTAYVWLVHDGELAPIIKQSGMPRSTVFLILGLLAVILILAYYIRRYYKQDP